MGILGYFTLCIDLKQKCKDRCSLDTGHLQGFDVVEENLFDSETVCFFVDLSFARKKPCSLAVL